MASDLELLQLEKEDVRLECEHFLNKELPVHWHKLVECILVCLKCLGGTSFSSSSAIEDKEEKKEEPQRGGRGRGRVVQKVKEKEEDIPEVAVEEEIHFLRCSEKAQKDSFNPISFRNETQGLEGFVTIDGWKVMRAEVSFSRQQTNGRNFQFASRIEADKTGLPWVLSEVQSAFNMMRDVFRFATRCGQMLDGGLVDWHHAQQAVLKMVKMMSETRTILEGESPHLFVQRRKLPLFSSSGHKKVWNPSLSPELLIEFGTDERLGLVVYIINLVNTQHRPNTQPGAVDLVGHSFHFKGHWFQVRDVVKAHCDLPTLQLAVAVISEVEKRLTRLLDLLLALRSD